MTTVSCECCDAIQLVRSQLRQVARDNRRGRCIDDELWQLVGLLDAAVTACNALHKHGGRQRKSEPLPFDVDGQQSFWDALPAPSAVSDPMKWCAAPSWTEACHAQRPGKAIILEAHRPLTEEKS